MGQKGDMIDASDLKKGKLLQFSLNTRFLINSTFYTSGGTNMWVVFQMVTLKPGNVKKYSGRPQVILAREFVNLFNGKKDSVKIPEFDIRHQKFLTIMNNIKKIEQIKSDRHLAEVLEMNLNNLSAYKNRGVVPREQVLAYVARSGISIEKLAYDGRL